MAELADALLWGGSALTGVWVQVSSTAPKNYGLGDNLSPRLFDFAKESDRYADTGRCGIIAGVAWLISWTFAFSRWWFHLPDIVKQPRELPLAHCDRAVGRAYLAMAAGILDSVEGFFYFCGLHHFLCLLSSWIFGDGLPYIFICCGLIRCWRR